jgi:hypothetical protein
MDDDGDFGYKPKIPTKNTRQAFLHKTFKLPKLKSIKSQSIQKNTTPFDFDFFCPVLDYFFLRTRHLSLSAKPPQVMVLSNFILFILFIYFNFVMLSHWVSSTTEI